MTNAFISTGFDVTRHILQQNRAPFSISYFERHLNWFVQQSNRRVQSTALIDNSSIKAREQVEYFWQLSQQGQFKKTAQLFANDAVLHDALYPSSFHGIDAIETHMSNMEKAFPVGKLRFILEDIMASAEYKVCVRWRVETVRTGFVLSSGISWYSMKQIDDGQLRFVEVFDVPEPKFKIAPLVLPLLGLLASVL